MNLAVHGIYLSADPTCTTGFFATVPLSTTASTVDFNAAPTLGSGRAPPSVGCVLILMEDNLSLSWIAGTYTSSTQSASDNVCNAGGSVQQKICRNTALTFPSQVIADAAAIGMTLLSACPSSPSGTEIIPLYISTNAVCTGAGPSVDQTACQTSNSGDGANAFAPPAIAGDTNNGIKLVAPSSSSSYVFVADTDQVAVGNDGGHCGSIGPPLFSFRTR